METPGGHHREDQNRSLQILAVNNWLEMFKHVQTMVEFYDSMISNDFYIFPMIFGCLWHGGPFGDFKDVFHKMSRGSQSVSHQQTLFHAAGCRS